MKNVSQRARGAAGFTLIEVLLAMVMLALVSVTVMTIGVEGVTQISTSSRTHLKDATSAQWTSLVFARDVQGASGVAAAECGAAAGGARLLTLRESTSSQKIEYRRSSTAPYRLTRVECATGRARTVVKDLDQAPAVRCDGSAAVCVTDAAPRTVTIDVSRSTSFDFELDGARRQTDGNSVDLPMEVPNFVALSGDTPLRVGGTSNLQVLGDAFINKPNDGSDAVILNGGGGTVGVPGSWRLSVTGQFSLQTGGTCIRCSTNSDKQPGTYSRALLDPLRFLAAPDTSTMPVRTDCPVTAGVRICQPGIYQVEFPPAGGGGGGVKDFELQPGVYVLRGGVKINNGSIKGLGVMLYNETNGIKVTGADLELSPPTSGPYSGILLFQARANTSQISIQGNASLASLTGTMYAPNSSGFVLGGGGGTMYVGRVIGSSLEASGNGTVIVNGG